MDKSTITVDNKNHITLLINPCKRGPISSPIVFNSISKGMEYIKNY